MLHELIDERAAHADPVCLYGYDLGALTKHVRRVVDALPARCRMFYAMKANSARPVLEALRPLVHGFDAASAGEVHKARAAGGSATVLLGGPAKTPSELATALATGVRRFHVESVLELHRLSAAARAAGVVADVLVRVNPAGPFPHATLAMAGRPTQFGIAEADLPEALNTLHRLDHVRFAGFHLHSVSNNLSAAAHIEMLALYRDIVLAWERRFGLRCSALDVGGGIGVNYGDTAAQFDWEGFAAELAGLLPTFPEHWREIDFECGRFLVAGCGYYAVQVLDVKHNHGVPYVLVRGGTHHFRLPASWQHSHPFTVWPVSGWPPDWPRPTVCDAEVTVVGELCTPKDVLASGVPVERVRAGDVLVFSHAGAYGWEISHHDFLSHSHPEHHYWS